ncbi:MAG: hypothetical protein AAF958_12045 [Planctomycetota bacterium]
MTADIYAEMDQKADSPATMLDELVNFLRQENRPEEMFEAMKMRTRQELGLPLITLGDDPPQSDAVENQLEHGLLDACRAAGEMIMKQGRVSAAWMYLRPTGDLELARKLIAKVPITDENYDDIVQVLLHEGVDVRRGFQAVLKHQGTCNSITLFEQALANQSKKDRRAAAEALLDHFYDELSANVRGDISRRTAPADPGESLLDMITKRPELLSQGAYHADTTHIASTVQIAKLVDTPERLTKAWELTQYGRRLDRNFQYPGDEPFVDFYPAFATFYSVLLGRDVEAGLTLFRRKAEQVDPMSEGTAAIETYVDLLQRSGREVEAIEAMAKLVPDQVPPQRIVPLMMEIVEDLESTPDASAIVQAARDRVAEFCQSRGDVLGYAAARLRRSTND